MQIERDLAGLHLRDADERVADECARGCREARGVVALRLSAALDARR
jgi:hypothetical protein